MLLESPHFDLFAGYKDVVVCVMHRELVIACTQLSDLVHADVHGEELPKLTKTFEVILAPTEAVLINFFFVIQINRCEFIENLCCVRQKMGIWIIVRSKNGMFPISYIRSS
jgi:hypothetical protein